MNIDQSTVSRAHTAVRRSWRILTAALIALIPLLAPAQSRADLSLGQAGDFAVLGKIINLGGGTIINGAVGVTSGGSITTSGALQTFNGPVDLDGATTSFTNFTGPNTPPTTTPTDLSTAVANLASAITSYAALSATPSTTLNNTTYTGNGGLNVISLNSINGGLTFTGTANDIFIIKVSGGVDFEGASGITLGGGVTAKHVLFDVVGNIKLGGSNTVSGTFISTGGSIEIGGGSTVNGALLANTGGLTFDVKSDATMTLNGTGNLFSAPAAVPEPGALALAASGLIAIGLARRFRSKRTAA